MQEKKSSSENKAMEMNATIEMRDHVRLIGWPQFPDEQVLFRIERVARRLGITPRRARAFWYGEATNIPAEHMDKARRLARAPLEEEARNEFAELQNRIARLEAALAVQDEDFHRPAIDALRVSSGRDDRAVD